LNLQQLRYFIDIAESQSMNKSAANLYVSQSALTRSMQALETEVGAELLTKSKKGVELTQNGRIFLEFAHDMLRSYTEMQTKFITQQSENSFKISAPLYGNYKHSISLLHNFSTQNPNAHINGFQYWNFASEIEELMQDKTDFMLGCSLALLESHPKSKLCSYLELEDMEWNVYMSRQSPAASQNKIYLEEQHDAVFIANVDVITTWIKQFCPENKTIFINGGSKAIMELLELHPHLYFFGAAGFDFDPEKICCKPVADLNFNDKYILIWKKGRKLTSLMNKFKKFVETQV